MTIHVKTTLILLGTPAIGIICGGLIIGAVSRSRMRAAIPFGGDGFVNRWVEIRHPDAEQKQAVEQIIESHAPSGRGDLCQASTGNAAACRLITSGTGAGIDRGSA